MKKRHFELASCLVAELEVFGDLPFAEFGIRSDWLIGMQNYGIPFVPTYWAGRRDARKKMRLVRATQQLADLGRLQSITKSRQGRTSHVIPSADLLAETIERLGIEVDQSVFFDGLQKTQWGRDMIPEIQRHLEAASIQPN